jgi:flagellar export protein FliJ
MTKRRARVKKVVSHRERELDERVKKLVEARTWAVQVEEERARADRALSKAIVDRQRLSAGPISAAAWRDANEWLASQERSYAHAVVAVERALAELERAQQGVLAARTALRGVEMLDQRLRAEETNADELAARRLEDELAGRRAAGRAGEGSGG